MAMDLIKQEIENYFPLTEEDHELLTNTFYPISFPAKTIIKKQGQLERNLYFLAKGIVKGYHYQDGKILVEHLMEEGHFFGSLKSFMAEEANDEIFEAVTDCFAYKVSKTDFELIKQSGKKWNEFIQGMINYSLDCKMERVRNFQSKTAKERYRCFLEESPSLALNVSVVDLASFLGIEKQSLSRIRSQLRK